MEGRRGLDMFSRARTRLSIPFPLPQCPLPHQRSLTPHSTLLSPARSCQAQAPGAATPRTGSLPGRRRFHLLQGSGELPVKPHAQSRDKRPLQLHGAQLRPRGLPPAHRAGLYAAPSRPGLSTPRTTWPAAAPRLWALDPRSGPSSCLLPVWPAGRCLLSEFRRPAQRPPGAWVTRPARLSRSSQPGRAGEPLPGRWMTSGSWQLPLARSGCAGRTRPDCCWPRPIPLARPGVRPG